MRARREDRHLGREVEHVAIVARLGEGGLDELGQVSWDLCDRHCTRIVKPRKRNAGGRRCRRRSF